MEERLPTMVLAAPKVEAVALLRVMSVGLEVLIVTPNPVDEADVLPAVSVCLAAKVCDPSERAEAVMLQLPVSSAVVLPSDVVPSVSYSVTVFPASAVPVKVGVVSLVMLSVLIALSVPAVMSGVLGAVGAV